MNYALNDDEVILFQEVAESSDFFEGDEVTVTVTNFNLILFKTVKKFLRKAEYFEEVVPVNSIKYYLDVPYFKTKNMKTSMVQFKGNINVNFTFKNLLINKKFISSFVTALTNTTLLERCIVKGKVALDKIEDYLGISIQETVRLALKNKFPGIVFKSQYLENKGELKVEESTKESGIKKITGLMSKFKK